VSGPGLAPVISFLDANGVLDAIGNSTDIAFTSSFNNEVISPFDSRTGCDDPIGISGAWCFQGSADLRGSTQIKQVPEPGMLALVSIGLLGICAASRRSKV